MVRVRIRRRQNRKGALISFSIQSDEFESNYERNKFYNGLYGRIQKVSHGDQVYKYRREGLLDEVPHIKVNKSVFIIPQRQLERVVGYLRNWEPKVEYRVFRILLSPEEAEELAPEPTQIEIE